MAQVDNAKKLQMGLDVTSRDYTSTIGKTIAYQPKTRDIFDDESSQETTSSEESSGSETEILWDSQLLKNYNNLNIWRQLHEGIPGGNDDVICEDLANDYTSKLAFWLQNYPIHNIMESVEKQIKDEDYVKKTRTSVACQREKVLSEIGLARDRNISSSLSRKARAVCSRIASRYAAMLEKYHAR